MKLFSEIKRIFQCNEIEITERLNTVEVSFSIIYQLLPNTNELNYICSIIPKRDTFTLTLQTDSGDIIRFTNKQTDTFDFSKLTEDLSMDDNIDVKVQIDKHSINGRFSIYDFPSFINDLLQRQPLSIMKWFSELLKAQQYLMFEVFDYDISLATRTIAFESSETATFKPKINRIQRLNACKETAYFYNMDTFEIIPDDFIIEGIVRAGDRLEPLFGKLSTILSLIYVASSASINDNVISVQISGQRTTNHELNLIDIQEDDKWISIYTWIFTDGNPTDKALIARNIISLYCKYDAFLNLDNTVFDAIKTNYNLYLRNNVNQYLTMKSDIAKFIQNIVTQIGDYAIDILSKFKSNLIAIFGFLFTVVLTRIGSTQKWDDIFTKDTIYLIEIFVIGSIVYMIICIFETKYKLKKAQQGYDELKNNYKDILSETEIKDSFNDDQLLKKTIKSARTGTIGWSVAWGLLLVIIILAIEIFTTNHGVFVWLWNRVF